MRKIWPTAVGVKILMNQRHNREEKGKCNWVHRVSMSHKCTQHGRLISIESDSLIRCAGQRMVIEKCMSQTPFYTNKFYNATNGLLMCTSFATNELVGWWRSHSPYFCIIANILGSWFNKLCNLYVRGVARFELVLRQVRLGSYYQRVSATCATSATRPLVPAHQRRWVVQQVLQLVVLVEFVLATLLCDQGVYRTLLSILLVYASLSWQKSKSIVLLEIRCTNGPLSVDVTCGCGNAQHSARDGMRQA